MCNRVLIDWPQSIARTERHECLTGELVNRQAISIDAENRIGGHDVANAARCNDVHRTGRGDVGQAREAKTRSEEHTSELQSLMRISYAVFCLKKKQQRQD